MADSTSNDWYITGIQLEVSDNATPFEHLSYGEELALCERYYHKADLASNKPFWLHPLTTGDAIYRRAYYKFPSEMRSTPTVTVTLTASGYTPTSSGTELISSSKTGVICDGAGSTNYAQCDALAADAEI